MYIVDPPGLQRYILTHQMRTKTPRGCKSMCGPPGCCNIVCLNVVPDPLSRNKNQRYHACIHDGWAMIKDTCHTRHHII